MQIEFTTEDIFGTDDGRVNLSAREPKRDLMHRSKGGLYQWPPPGGGCRGMTATGGELRNVKPQQTLFYSSRVCFQQSNYPTTILSDGPPPLARGGKCLSCPYTYKITVFQILRYRADVREHQGTPLRICRNQCLH